MGCIQLDILEKSESPLRVVKGAASLEKWETSENLPTLKNRVNYYPFGMVMPGRSYTSESYRYGFNGHERDDEVSGAGNSLDFGARMFNPRLGRFFSTDPWEKKYPFQTTYSYHGNQPVTSIDWKGYGGDGECESCSHGTGIGWPGVTLEYGEGEIAGGFFYGFQALRQFGDARDEIGKTQYIMESEVVIDPSEKATFILGGKLVVTTGVRQSFYRETFLGLSKENTSSYGLGAAFGGGGGIELEDWGFSVEISIGGEGALTLTNTHIVESISLTYGEVVRVEKFAEVMELENSWHVGNVEEVLDSDGNLTGYKGKLFVGYRPGVPGYRREGLVLFSENQSVWYSEKYKEQSDYVEAVDQGKMEPISDEEPIYPEASDDGYIWH